MFVSGLTAIPSGFPSGTLRVEAVAQPDWSVELQLRSSSTVTVPALPGPPAFATYTVWVTGSTAPAAGLVPTVTVGGVALHPMDRCALQVRVSIIATVLALFAT